MSEIPFVNSSRQKKIFIDKPKTFLSIFSINFCVKFHSDVNRFFLIDFFTDFIIEVVWYLCSCSSHRQL